MSLGSLNSASFRQFKSVYKRYTSVITFLGHGAKFVPVCTPTVNHIKKINMKQKINFFAIVFVMTFCLFQNDAVAQDMKNEKGKDMKIEEDGSKMKMSMDEMKSWPMASQMAVKEQMDLYGKPAEMTPTTVVWHNNGPWKKTIISKMENKHDFPKTHMDCMEQCVSYKVPIDKYDDLAQFDGSVTVDRTQGLLAARCDKEENNFLALNLAHDVITGNKSVEEARKAYGEMIKQAMAGNKPEYMKKLTFSSNMNAADPDVMTVGMK